MTIIFSTVACSPKTSVEAVVPSESATAISADGVSIRFDVYGDGSPALVLVHGWSCDRSYWSAQVGPLSRSNMVVALDIGGHGDSGQGREDWTIDSFGADVAAVVDAVGIESAVLVGHSMGGDVIFQAARRLPGKVEALIMVDTYKRLGSPRTDEQIENIVREFEPDFAGVTEHFVRGMFSVNADSVLVERVATDMAAAPSDVALSSLRSSFRHAREVPGLIAQLDLPVTAINPDDAPTDVESMMRHGVEIIIMPGVGHFMMMEDPDRFNALLLKVLEQFR